MLSMSGAILRLSWFISNSYSKSEIARSPFTIAFAPCSRAKSTTSVSKVFTCTLASSAISAWMNADALSASNRVFCLRTGWFTTATITLSNTARARADDVEVAERDRVVGARADALSRCSSAGHGGSRSGCRRRCARRSSGRASRSGSRLSDSVTVRASSARTGGSSSASRPREAGRGTIWRVAEHEVEGARPRRRASQASASRRCTLGLDARAPRGCARIAATARAVAVDEHRLGRAARQRLDAERARAGEQVEHARALDGRRGSRTAPRGRGRLSAGCRPARRLDARGRRRRRRRPSSRGCGSRSEPEARDARPRAAARARAPRAPGRASSSSVAPAPARARAARRPRAAAPRGTRAARAGACRAPRPRRAARGRPRRA